MANISQIEVNNTTYDIYDATARDDIATIQDTISSMTIDRKYYAMNGIQQIPSGTMTKMLTVPCKKGLNLVRGGGYVASTQTQQNVVFNGSGSATTPPSTTPAMAYGVQVPVGFFNSAQYHSEVAVFHFDEDTDYYLYGFHGGTGNLGLRAEAYVVNISFGTSTE